MTTQRIERIIEEIIEEDMTPGDSPGELRRHLRSALTAFAEETEKEQQERDTELMMHEMFLDSLLDDLGAPTHPNNDKTRTRFGSYGRLKAYAESIGVKASIWEPLKKMPEAKCVHCNSPEGLHHPKTKQCPDPLGWRSLKFTASKLHKTRSSTGEKPE